MISVSASTHVWGKVMAMNVDMERRTERLHELFPEPKYRVELKENETVIWVVNSATGAIVGVGEHDFELDPEGAGELSYLRRALA
jgi:hypothetical protein